MLSAPLVGCGGDTKKARYRSATRAAIEATAEPAAADKRRCGSDAAADKAAADKDAAEQGCRGCNRAGCCRAGREGPAGAGGEAKPPTRPLPTRPHSRRCQAAPRAVSGSVRRAAASSSPESSMTTTHPRTHDEIEPQGATTSTSRRARGGCRARRSRPSIIGSCAGARRRFRGTRRRSARSTAAERARLAGDVDAALRGRVPRGLDVLGARDRSRRGAGAGRRASRCACAPASTRSATPRCACAWRRSTRARRTCRCPG